MNNTSQNYDQTIERYLASRLDGTERDAFEIRLLEDPELLDAVQRQEAFNAAIRQQGKYLAAKPTSKFNSLNFFDWLLQPYSMASATVLAISMIITFRTLVVEPQLPLSGTEPDAIYSISNSLILQTVRGQDTIITANGTAPVSLTIDPGPLPATDTGFSIFITDLETEEVILRAQNVTANQQGWLELVITQDLSGSHQVQLTRENQVLSLYEINFEN